MNIGTLSSDSKPQIDVDNPFEHGFSYADSCDLTRKFGSGALSNNDIWNSMESEFATERWMIEMLVKTELKKNGKVIVSDGWIEEVEEHQLLFHPN